MYEISLLFGIFFGTDKHAGMSLNAYNSTKQQVEHTAFCFAIDRPHYPARRSRPAQETPPLR